MARWRYGRRIRASGSLLSRAVAAHKASLYSGSGPLLDLTGRGHHAQLGSTSGADSNDPVWLPWTGTNYVYLPGLTGNSLTADGEATITAEGNHLEGCTFNEDGTEATLDGVTWAINRASSGLKSVAVDRPLLLLGTSKYLEIADHADLDFGASDSFTVLVAFRRYGTAGSVNILIANRSTTGGAEQGWELSIATSSRTARLDSGDGTDRVTVNAPAISDGVFSVIAGRVDRSGASAQAFLNGTGGSTVDPSALGSVANASPVRIGTFVNGTVFTDMEYIGSAIFRRALSAAEIQRAGAELLAL